MIIQNYGADIGLAVKYPAPTNLNYYGILGYLLSCINVTNNNRHSLVMLYNHMLICICKCRHIMRDVNTGWILRYVMPMELFIFHCSYAHIMRGLFYGSYYFQENFYGVRCNNLITHDNYAFLGYIYHGVK